MYNKPSVLFVSDDSIINEAFKLLLAELGFATVGSSDSAPQILLIDLDSEKAGGLGFLYRLRLENSNSKILALSRHCEDEFVSQAILTGANGVVHKGCSRGDLSVALNKVLGQDLYLPKQFEHLAISVSLELEKQKRNSKKTSKLGPLDRLSSREREVFFLITDGQPNRSIAANLLISPRTVETHRTRIMNKLGCKSNANLIKYAIKHKLISL